MMNCGSVSSIKPPRKPTISGCKFRILLCTATRTLVITNLGKSIGPNFITSLKEMDLAIGKGYERLNSRYRNAKTMDDWPLWEVFIRSQNGLAHKHAGSLHAPDAALAVENARDVYTRRNEGVSIWVVRSIDIYASDP